jgi:hypothetical protein
VPDPKHHSAVSTQCVTSQHSCIKLESWYGVSLGRRFIDIAELLHLSINIIVCNKDKEYSHEVVLKTIAPILKESE